MKKLLCLLLLIGLLGCAGMDLTQTAYPVAPSPLKPYGSDSWTLPDSRPNLTLSGSVVMGFPVSEITTEYPVWEQLDSNGDVVASMTVVCSDITDASQDCSVKLYTMVAGVLTLDTTFDGP